MTTKITNSFALLALAGLVLYASIAPMVSAQEDEGIKIYLPIIMKEYPVFSAIVGPAGGVIEVNDPTHPLYGVKLDVPAGALDQEVTITLAPVSQKHLEGQIGQLDLEMRFFGGIQIDADSAILNKSINVTLPNSLGATSSDQLLVGVIVQSSPSVKDLVYQGSASVGSPIHFSAPSFGKFVVLSPSKPLVVVDGYLRNSFGNQVANARVVTTDSKPFIALSSSNGYFEIPAAPAEAYTVIAASLPIPGTDVPDIGGIVGGKVEDLYSKLLNWILKQTIELDQETPCPCKTPLPNVQLRSREQPNPPFKLYQNSAIRTYVEFSSPVYMMSGLGIVEGIRVVEPTLDLTNPEDIWDLGKKIKNMTGPLDFVTFPPTFFIGDSTVAKVGVFTGVLQSLSKPGNTEEIADITLQRFEFCDEGDLTLCPLYNAKPAAPVSVFGITTDSPLPGGAVATPYNTTLEAIGGEPPYIWSIESGSSLPDGLLLNPTNGTIGGTPTATTIGTNIFTVRVTDNASQGATKDFELSVLGITTTSPLPGGAVATPYNTTLEAIGGEPPYIWSIESGSSLPDGLLLNPTDGTITGTPTVTATGTATFTVRVTDSNPTPRTATKNLVLTILPADFSLVITKTGTGNGTVTSDPPGINCGSTCMSSFVDGTVVTLSATAASDSAFGGWGGDCIGTTPSMTLTITADTHCNAIFNKRPIITTNSLPDGEGGVPYTAQVTATGGAPPYTWSATFTIGGSQSYSFTMDPTTGVISGVMPGCAEVPCIVTAAVLVRDNVGATSGKALTITSPPVPYYITIPPGGISCTLTYTNSTSGFATLQITGTTNVPTDYIVRARQGFSDDGLDPGSIIFQFELPTVTASPTWTTAANGPFRENSLGGFASLYGHAEAWAVGHENDGYGKFHVWMYKDFPSGSCESNP